LNPHRRLPPLALCLPGTRVEIISEIMSWVSSSNGELLWLNGKPGSGKSSLVSTIAHWARQMGEHSRLGAFLRFDSEMKDDSSRVITTLAYRLAEFDDRIGDQISKVVKKYPDIADWPLLDSQFQELVVNPLELVKDLKDEGPIVVLVDALDKLELCKKRTELLKVLAGGFGAKLPFMRLIMSSQRQAGIVSKFESPKMQHIHGYSLDVSDGDVIRLNQLNRDIRLYFEYEFNEIDEIDDPEFRALCDQHGAIEKLTERACGLFIRASRTVQFINSKSNPAEQLLTILYASGSADFDAGLDPNSISPDIISTTAIPAINAQDSTMNVAGRDQIFIVDPNCDQGIWINHPATQTHHSSRRNLPVVVRCHPIYKL
jgi:nucleoside-triphosphatase THEP1